MELGVNGERAHYLYRTGVIGKGTKGLKEASLGREDLASAIIDLSPTLNSHFSPRGKSSLCKMNPPITRLNIHSL